MSPSFRDTTKKDYNINKNIGGIDKLIECIDETNILTYLQKQNGLQRAEYNFFESFNALKFQAIVWTDGNLKGYGTIERRRNNWNLHTRSVLDT